MLSLLRELRTPVVTTLHTVPHRPTPTQRKVLGEILERLARLIVMSEKAREFGRDVYGECDEKIDSIPHGIHEVPFTDPNFYKDNFGVEGKRVLLTFGLLSQNKGVENVIGPPRSAGRSSRTWCSWWWAMHPNVVRQEGESYRLSLQRLAHDLKVERHVIFYNRFVSLEELMEFIGAVDVYITPYLNQDQIASGTLAYVLGRARRSFPPPIGTRKNCWPTAAACWCPLPRPTVLAAILHLLEDETSRHAIRKQAYPPHPQNDVASRGAGLHAFVRAGLPGALRRGVRPFRQRPWRRHRPSCRRLNITHLRRLTDDVGILQHAIGTVPKYSQGYTTDDNARALLLTIYLEQLGRRDGAV